MMISARNETRLLKCLDACGRGGIKAGVLKILKSPQVTKGTTIPFFSIQKFATPPELTFGDLIEIPENRRVQRALILLAQSYPDYRVKLVYMPKGRPEVVMDMTDEVLLFRAGKSARQPEDPVDGGVNIDIITAEDQTH